MENLRLFGVKLTKNKVRINDMKYLHKINSVSFITSKLNWYNTTYDYIKSCGFEIIGEVKIPKYKLAFVCKDSSETLSEKIIKKEYEEVLK